METAITTLDNQYTLWQSVVLNMLKPMTLGSLRLTLPSGETLLFGNGNEVKASLQINNTSFFRKSILYGDIGFGESYVDGDWDTDNIERVISWFILNIENAPSISGTKRKTWAINILKYFNKFSHFARENSITGSKKNIAEHYDLNNDFFHEFLDPTMTYSSAYFNKSNPDETLEQAQYNKYDRLCKQLHLKSTDHVLEIGSGWGGNAIFIAKNYGCKVTTVTISEEQYKYAKALIEKEKLADKIDIRLTDYRNLEGQFDKIVSIEMLEAVGHKFLDTYFKKCNDLLKKEGLLAIQVITSPDSRYNSLRKNVDWIQKHIFPGSLLPSVAAINGSVNRTGDLTMCDLKDMGLDYAKTLNIWKTAFNKNIDTIVKLGFNKTFIRKWNYYFSYCESAFLMRNINVMQLVYTRPNNTSY